MGQDYAEQTKKLIESMDEDMLKGFIDEIQRDYDEAVNNEPGNTKIAALGVVLCQGKMRLRELEKQKNERASG